MTRVRSALLAMLVAYAAATRAQDADWLWIDGFEQDAISAFRFSTLVLRDPHVFLQLGTPPLALCFDFTDQGIPGAGISFNGLIANGYNSDSNPVDGFLDSSTVLLFRPLRVDGAAARVDWVAAQCTAPVEGTQCLPAATGNALVNFYAAQESGTCLGALPGTVGVPAYSPALAAATARCFRTAARNLVLENGGVPIPLRDAQIGARFDLPPLSTLSSGVLRGFLTEAAAAAILLPNPVAGQPPIPLSSLLPGGAGNCSLRNDRDTHAGESGWWFYFNFSAALVPWTEF